MCIYTHKYIAMRINTCYNNGTKGVVDVPMTARQMIKLLEKNGFEEIRQVGSHKQFFNKKTGKIDLFCLFRKRLVILLTS